MPTLDTLVFDLDGTLIDSAPGILTCFAAVLSEHGITLKLPLDSFLIGPPLVETLTRITGLESPADLQPLIDSFKRCYDGKGVRATPAYPGVAALLDGLRDEGIDLHIATNKRLAPSLAILSHLGLLGHFSSIYALDMREPRLPDKATLIDCLIAEKGLARNRVGYVGDKEEDGLAAAANGLPFYAADWGYGDFAAATTPADWRLAASPAALFEIIRVKA